MAPNNTLPIWGNEKTMNLNTLILTNIQSSPYFKVNLYELKTYHEAIDEIYYKVSHLEPWEKGSRKTAGQTGMCGGVRGVGAGGIVSSAYCLLYKLFTLRLTRKQLQGLLDHADSPYIRGLGFMYIRYTQDPKYFWEWYEPYLDDDEEIDVKAGGGHTITIGEMLRQWLVKLEWYSTLFPRIPVPVQKDIDVKMRARLAEKFRQFEGDPSQQPAMEEQGGQQQQPRHIADDEVNFGEAEKYATNAAIRKRSPTPPYRSRPRTPPPRRRTPPPRHRSPPRHRGDSHRSRSPRRGGSASDDYSRELQRERERQNKDRGRRSRSRERKSHYDRDSDSRKRSSYKDDDDDDPINFAKNMLRQKEQREKEDREQQEKRSQDGESDDDDDPINFAKKLLKQKEEQQRKIRERELALQKKAEGVTEENNKSSSKHSKSSSDRHKHKKSSKEHKRKRSRSRDRNSKKSREKGSSKHRSRSRERKKHRAEHDHKEKRDLET